MYGSPSALRGKWAVYAANDLNPRSNWMCLFRSANPAITHASGSTALVSASLRVVGTPVVELSATPNTIAHAIAASHPTSSKLRRLKRGSPAFVVPVGVTQAQ